MKDEHEKTNTLVKRTPTVGPCLSQFTPFICPSVRRTSLPGPIYVVVDPSWVRSPASEVGMSWLRWKIRQKALKTWQESAQIVLEFWKSARKLLVVVNYFLADVHKNS